MTGEASLRVLVVDDEPGVRGMVASALQASGFHTHVAGDFAEALQWLDRDETIAVLVTDLRMPGRDGLALVTETFERRGDRLAVEALVMSGHGSMDEVTMAMRAGAVDYLAKPFPLRALTDGVARAMARATRRRATARALQAAGTGRDSHPTATPADLAQSLAQELRTPLVPVLGFGEMLSDGGIDSDTARMMGDEIVKGARQLLGSIDRMLASDKPARP